MKIFFTIVFSLFMALAGITQTITVTNTNCSVWTQFVDGTYVLTGTPVNGKNQYTHSGITIFWDGNKWSIRIGPFDLYTNPNDVGLMPPATGWVYGTGCTHEGLPILTGDVVLPVELISFKGELVRESIILSWKTASELNNEKFEIERSSDGQFFQIIGEVEGKGTTVEEQNYLLEDKDLRNGTYYYRLKQIDFDGKFEYSPIVAVDVLSENNDFVIAPNPVALGGTLSVQLSDNPIGEMVLYNALGAAVAIQPISENQDRIELSLANLPKGIYSLVFATKGQQQAKRVVIQ